MVKNDQIIRIGTRGSKLALIQANFIKQRLIELHPENDLTIEIEIISTTGDRIQNRPLSEVGGKGLFTLEIEERLSSGEVDLAVHSTKDMATKLPDDLELVCFPERENVADAFISNKANTIEELPEGAVVGSASLRRQALLKRLRPDLEIVLFRGNVDTRLKKIAAGEVDATLLAVAGLNRMGLQSAITCILPPEQFLPAPAQGAICIETRKDNAAIRKLLHPLNHEATEITVAAERAFLASLDGSCRTPIAALATLYNNRLSFHGMILTPDGSQSHEHRVEGNITNPAKIGAEAAAKVREAAGPGFFESW